ncbi:hypothetical protein RHGRI_014902 [Rhododendron griersonianum]|uniref:F-box domain-containing protein n=1 Tax=Rhododendron griersonianum TaxID=479676 RepID=A0AAV6KBR4_9ERIC|nr:hypothetical protein RHGRI_014902 [Rhododendron griersonianum]
MATESDSTCGESENANQIPPSCDEFGPNLPPELIAAILSRLPVKSLLRFRCVCKSWHSLIFHPKFVKTHLSLASINTDYTHHRLLLRCGYRTNDVKSCSLYAVLHEHSDNAVELDCPIKTPHRYWKSKSLPSDGTSCHYLARYGFGYDDTIDDYKVVGFFGDVSKGRYEVEVKVYTLRSDSWKKIGGFPHNLSTLNGLGTFVNGALHWIVTMKSNMIIVSLDLAKETFAEVLQPDYRDGHWYETLFVLNGCLGMLCGNNACADIWVMEQYGTY